MVDDVAEDVADRAAKLDAMGVQVSEMRRELERLRRPRGGGSGPGVAPRAPDPGFDVACGLHLVALPNRFQPLPLP